MCVKLAVQEEMKRLRELERKENIEEKPDFEDRCRRELKQKC